MKEEAFRFPRRGAVYEGDGGRALVLTDIRGCREVVRHRTEGMLVPVRDGAGLAAAISTLVDDAQLRERLGGAARARALVRFDERRVKEIVVANYHRVLASKGRAIAPEEKVVSSPR